MDLTENIRLVYTNRFSNPAHEEFYQYTGFSNFGYWYPSTRDGKEASANLVERLLTYIPHKSGTILDVACGQGGTTRRLLAFYEPSKITAINLDEKQLKNAKKNAPGCNFLVMDAAALGFTSAAFDNILCV
jgi:ubiquinone/menaquinone biosynthesis C-methylase UbiE